MLVTFQINTHVNGFVACNNPPSPENKKFPMLYAKKSTVKLTVVYSLSPSRAAQVFSASIDYFFLYPVKDEGTTVVF